MMKYMQKLDWKLDLPLLSYDYQKCMFVDFLIGYTCPLLSVGYLLIFEDAVQSLLTTCLHDVCSLLLTEPRTNQI